MPDYQNVFNNIQRKYRKDFLKHIKTMEGDFQKINDKLMRRIQQLSYDYAAADGTIPSSNLNQFKTELNALSDWFTNEMKNFLDDNIEKSAQIAIKGQDTATEYYVKALMEEVQQVDKKLLSQALKDGQNGILLRVKYGQGLPQSIREYIWNFRWDDGLNLSERLWKLDGTMKKNLQTIIEQSVNQGKSAVEFSRAVEDYLDRPGKPWRTDIKPGLEAGDTVKTSDGRTYTIKQPRATVKYNALRLARTETNQAYHRAQQVSDKESDVVKGTKWNLSASHPQYPPSYNYRGYNEICDYRAKANHHNKGAGVYPAGETPYDHPNGFCYLTSVLRKKDELINKLKDKYE